MDGETVEAVNTLTKIINIGAGKKHGRIVIYTSQQNYRFGIGTEGTETLVVGYRAEPNGKYEGLMRQLIYIICLKVMGETMMGRAAMLPANQNNCIIITNTISISTGSDQHNYEFWTELELC